MNVKSNENLILGAQRHKVQFTQILTDGGTFTQTFFFFFFCTQISNKIQQITWKIKVLYTETYN